MTEGISFGTGRYGDLAATFAAIYLDRAARNVLLDRDISSGALREPLLKVMSLMRSMKFVPLTPVIDVHRTDMYEDIGQMAYEFDSVFSFFLPEFKPYGRVGDAALVSPEATLLDMPRTIGLLNGMISLIKYGFSRCSGGWRLSGNCHPSTSNGFLEFNKTHVGSEIEFSFETFEGPSLKGGLDNRWVGKHSDTNNGKITTDPLDRNNHVLYFPNVELDFFSPRIQNLDSNGKPVVVKFRYLAFQSDIAGGCIGYQTEETLPIKWQFCDLGKKVQSGGVWISCQFVVPEETGSFRIALKDGQSPSGDAFFDDIQIASGEATTCNGVYVPKNKPPGKEGYSNAVVDELSILLTAGRLGSKAKSIIVDAFDNAGNANDGLTVAQQLIISSSEFHATNSVKSLDKPRDKYVLPQPTEKPYKAVIYLMLSGGCDSFNMLVPHTCRNGLYESYLGER